MSDWFKYDFVCPYCDSLITYTVKKKLLPMLCDVCEEGFLTMISEGSGNA